MIKKEDRSKFLQQQLDDKQYTVNYHFITRIKGLDSTIKLLLNQMCNDIYMNGFVTWKQQTYADYIGLSKRQIIRLFNTLINVGILIPDKDNKIGGKSNKYKMNLDPTLIKKLIEKPVTSVSQTGDMDDTLPVTHVYQTGDIGVTYNKPNKSNKDLLGEETLFERSSPTEDEIELFIKTLK